MLFMSQGFYLFNLRIPSQQPLMSTIYSYYTFKLNFFKRIVYTTVSVRMASQTQIFLWFIKKMNHCLAICDFGMEIKLGLSFSGCMRSHSVYIHTFCCFLVASDLDPRLDPKAVTHDVRLNKRIVYTETLKVIPEISESDWVYYPLNKLTICENSALCMRYLCTCVFLSGSGCYLLVWRFFGSLLWAMNAPPTHTLCIYTSDM